MKKSIDTMNNQTALLQETITQLQETVACLAKERDELKSKNQYLLKQFRLAQQKQFGKSSEAHAGQGELFNEAEQIIDEVIEPEVKTVSMTRRKPKRQALPKNLE